MMIDSLLAKIASEGNPTERELRNWLGSRFSGSKDVAKVQRVLDLPSKTKLLVNAAKHSPRTLAKALLLRKMAKELHRKVFNF